MPNSAPLDVKDLIQVEASKEILSFRFLYNNLCLWPFIRCFILQSAITDIFALDNPYALKLKTPIKNIPKYLLNTFNNNPYSKPHPQGSNIVIFSSGVVNVRQPNGIFINKLYDFFALEYPHRTLIIEDSNRRELTYCKPRKFSNVKYHDILYLSAWLKSQLNHYNKEDQTTIDRFIIYLQLHFPYSLPDSIWHKARNLLLKMSRILPELHIQYQKLFKFLDPKLIILEDGSYGRKSYILKWAKVFGIKTAEFQHGIIAKNHYAYNYHETLANSEYRDYLPDFFLTFGEFWGKQISLPSKIITIGHPYLVEMKQQIKLQSAVVKKRQILVVSAACTPKELSKVVLALQKQLNPEHFEIRFRPHPVEKRYLDSRYRDLKKAGIKFSLENFYDSIIDTDIIISTEVSTTLFEALLFEKQIFVQNNPFLAYYFEPNIFETFQNVDDLAALIQKGQPKKYSPEYFWESNWRENYRTFIEREIS
jgi:hypothetical protein